MKSMILGLMMSAAFVLGANAKPAVVPVGDWQMMTVRDWPLNNQPICTVFHRSKELRVFAAFQKNGATYVGISVPSMELTPGMFLDGAASLWLDGNEAVIVDAWSLDKLQSIVVGGRREADGTDSILSLLAKSSRITVHAPGFEATVTPAETARAIRLVSACAAILPDAPPVAATKPDEPTSLSTLLPGEGEEQEEVEGDTAEAEHAERAAKGEQASEADRLGQAMQGMTGGSPIIAEYSCPFTMGQLLGVLTPSSNAESDVMTLGIAEDGSGELHGRRFLPVYTDGSAAAGGIRSLAYRLTDMLAATQAQPETVAPPLLNMTEREMNAYRGAINYMQGLVPQLLGNRQRYLTVSLADDTLRFLDLSPQNQATNVAALDCARTQ